jgi:hypothetical protein
LVAWFAAMNERADGTGRPRLRAFSGPEQDGWLDPHPTDILRPFLIKGATEALRSLSANRRNQYAQDLVELAQLTGAGAESIRIQGRVPTGPRVGLRFNGSLPMQLMQSSAQQVGSLIASGTFAALGNNNIQALETWDDTDEDTALQIAEKMMADRSVAGQGDDAALLAGATLAAFDQPGSYDTITDRLNQALDASFATDPFWGTPTPHRAFIPTELLPDDSEELIDTVTIG